MVVLAVVGALVIAGVSVGITLAFTNDAERPPVAAASSAPSSTPAPPTSTKHVPRVIETKIGEQARFTGSRGGGVELVLTITQLKIDGRCTAPYAQKSENGHFLFVDVSVETSPTMSSSYSANLLNPQGFSIIGPDGITETGGSLSSSPSFGCVPRSKMLPLTLSPGQKYTGTIVLDTRNTRGKLLLTPIGLDMDTWYWKLGEGT
ncbi:hypothetical protein [Amycolatopsis sp. GM8]|uniref:hypothetical protein n=1 Tax=Amycolatopsis sp. GM8 TaxID=2896530 RepID=UPI001F44C5D1|nr:hypothetical protein [Amycolatopsis sp. GM8]